MAGGPAREGGPGDPRVARMDYDPQTVPLPYGTTSGDPYRNYPDDGPDPGYGEGGPYGRGPGRGLLSARPARLPPPLAGAALAPGPRAGAAHAQRDRVRRAVRAHPVGRQRPRAGPGHRHGAPRRLPGTGGTAAVRRVPGGDRGSPLLLRARGGHLRDRPGRRRPDHRPRRPGWRDAVPAAGQDALHLRPERVQRRGQAGHAGRQARPGLQQGQDPPDVRRCRLLRPRLLRPGPGQLRVLRHRPGAA